MSIGGIVLTNKTVFVIVCVCLHDPKQKIERSVFFDASLWMQLDFHKFLASYDECVVFPRMRCFLRVSHTDPYRPERETPLNTLGETLGLQQLSLYPP